MSAIALVEINRTDVVAHLDTETDTVYCRDCVLDYDTADLEGLTQAEVDFNGDVCGMCESDLRNLS